MIKTIRYLPLVIMAVLLNSLNAPDVDAQRQAPAGKPEGQEDIHESESDEEHAHIGDENLEIDEVRETIDEAEVRDRIGWADQAFQLRGSQDDYDQVMEADDPEEAFYAIQESDEVVEVRDRIDWADQAFQLRGSQDDYDQVMEADDPKEAFYAIQESEEEHLHIGDEDWDIDEVREAVEEMSTRFAGTVDMFRSLEKAVVAEYEGECDDCIEKSLKKFQRYAKMRRMNDEEKDEFLAVADLFVVTLHQAPASGEDDRIGWADQALELRGSQDDYDQVMEADDPEEEFYAIQESEEEHLHIGDEADGHIGDEDLDIDEVREAVDEMATRFAGTRDIFRSLEKAVVAEYKDECDDCIEKSLKKFQRYTKMRRMDDEEEDEFLAVADLFLVALHQAKTGDEGDDHDNQGDDHDNQWSTGPNSLRLVLRSINDGIAEIDIEVAECEPINGWGIQVRYDSDALNFESFTPKFVKGAFIPLSIENAEGVKVGGAVLGRNAAKSDGDGILGTIKLGIVGTLPSNISLTEPTFRGDVENDIIIAEELLEITP